MQSRDAAAAAHLLEASARVAASAFLVALQLLLFPAFGLQQTLGPSLNLGLSFAAEVLRRSTALLWQFARPRSL